MQVRALTAVFGQSNRSVYVYRSANIEISAGHGNRRRARLPDRSDAVVAMAFYLGGCNLGVQDSASVTQPAGLLFVSPGQINFQIPMETALGAAAVTITTWRHDHD